MKSLNRPLRTFVTFIALSMYPLICSTSSHMDAPLITLDDAANTTDVYAFVSQQNGRKYLTTAVAVYPFEEPGSGPNTYRFDENVLYEIHLSLGDDLPMGKKTLSFQFNFKTEFKKKNTILQSYLGKLTGNIDSRGFDNNLNLRQSYTVNIKDHNLRRNIFLGKGLVAPSNQGRLTPFYNLNNDGDMPSKAGVDSESELDQYTGEAIARLKEGYLAFAGQREDGFFADIQSVFDLDFLFSGGKKPFDSQRGFNVHMIVLNIPIEQISDYGMRAGVFATTSRRRVNIIRSFNVLNRGHSNKIKDLNVGSWVQVGRQGNPLFNEGFVAIQDKDRYSRSSPKNDANLFKRYALNPELATIIGMPSIYRSNRFDLVKIYIPDVIKIDLTTPPAKLARQTGFHRLSQFGGDTLVNENGENVPGGWPNGRRFGDDVFDLMLIVLAPDILGIPSTDIDKVPANDATYNKVFPYAGTPLNGRNHMHKLPHTSK